MAVKYEKTVLPNEKKVPHSFFKKYIIADNIEFLLLALPAILFFLIFAYLPMFGAVVAFKEYHFDLGIFASPWNGLKNFEFFFTSQDVWRITRNTAGYGFLFIILGLITSVGLALMLFEIKNKAALKYYQTTVLLPNFMSWVIVGYITYILLQPDRGVLNQITTTFGGGAAQWYLEPKFWPCILSVVNIWKTIGMGSVVYYAALMGVSPDIYEAATIDGASKWQQTISISIPSIKNVMVILTILSLGNILRGDFGLFYQISRDVGVLYPTTDIIDTYVFRGLQTGSIGQTAAVGLFQSVVGFFMVVVTNYIVKKIEPESAMF